MDRFLATFPAVQDGDLMVSVDRGVAWQADMKVTASYDDAYFNKCAGYEGQEICRAIHVGRLDLVTRHIGPYEPICDIGIGSGEFIRYRKSAYGIDVNEKAMRWLKSVGRIASSLNDFRAFSMWDVLEHLDDPDTYFGNMKPSSFLFLSIPIFSDLWRIRESRHYRPGEHLMYFTEDGLVEWLGMRGFSLLERADFETKAGRDSIISFAFRRVVA